MSTNLLPKEYQWLINEPGPKLVLEFLKIYGIKEKPGNLNNPEILKWAEECGIPNYTHDSIAWCGLTIALLVKRTERPVVENPLWARNWLNFGVEVPIKEAKFGDILVFKRPGGGGHVGLYIAEDSTAFHCGGGNTGDMVKIARIAKSRCIGVRRPVYNVMPSNVREIIVKSNGKLSTNEG